MTIILEVSAMLDAVCYQLLLTRLDTRGVGSSFRFRLSGCLLFTLPVVLSYVVICAVLQRFVLGPLLSCIYARRLENISKQSSLRIL